MTAKRKAPTSEQAMAAFRALVDQARRLKDWCKERQRKAELERYNDPKCWSDSDEYHDGTVGDWEQWA
jgi:hypothetical protein